MLAVSLSDPLSSWQSQSQELLLTSMRGDPEVKEDKYVPVLYQALARACTCPNCTIMHTNSLSLVVEMDYVRHAAGGLLPAVTHSLLYLCVFRVAQVLYKVSVVRRPTWTAPHRP